MDKSNTCLYGKCYLPENNNKFLLQVVYVIIGIFVLLSKPENFTYFQTLLFVSSILIDIISFGPVNKVAHFIRWVIGVFDTLIVIVCFLGLGGIIGQTPNTYFFVDTMRLLGGFCINKDFIALILIANLAIPFAYYNYSPCKKNLKIKEAISAIRR